MRKLSFMELNEISRLVAQGKTEAAIKKLVEQTEGTEYYAQAISLASRFANNRKRYQSGLVTDDMATAKANQITLSILQLVEEASQSLAGDAGTVVEDSFHLAENRTVEIILEGEIADFNKTRRENLIRTVAAILDLDSNLVTIKRIVPGSIKVYIELPEDKAQEFFELVLQKDQRIHILLDNFNVKSVRLKGAARVDRRWKDFFRIRSLRNIAATLAVLATILGGMAEFIGFINVIPRWGGDTGADSITVLVHGKGGKDELVLPGRGIVYLIYGDAKIPEPINQEGEATFKQIPSEYFEPGASVELLFEDPEGEPYRVVNPDSNYSLTREQYIALEVHLQGMDRLEGIVKNFVTGEPIDSAEIRIRGMSFYSNEYGEFTIEIPEDRQRQFIDISAFKEGYQRWELSNVPTTTEKPIAIGLKPK